MNDLAKLQERQARQRKWTAKCKSAPEQIHVHTFKRRLHGRANKIKNISISAGNIDRYAFLDVPIVKPDTQFTKQLLNRWSRYLLWHLNVFISSTVFANNIEKMCLWFSQILWHGVKCFTKVSFIFKCEISVIACEAVLYLFHFLGTIVSFQ